VWERGTVLDCPLCRQPLCCDDAVFAYSLSEEHEQEGVFEVDRTESALLTCSACSDRHQLPGQLNRRRRMLVAQLGISGAPAGEVIALVSRYACQLCGWRIPDGRRLFTAAFERGRLERRQRLIDELKIDLIACLHCAERSGLRRRLHKMVAALLIDCRRQRLRLLR
jgi:hypothetical protein